MGKNEDYDEDERYDEMKKDYDAMMGYERMCRDAQDTIGTMVEIRKQKMMDEQPELYAEMKKML